jgi:hypothetical protein
MYKKNNVDEVKEINTLDNILYCSSSDPDDKSWDDENPKNMIVSNNNN